MSSSSVVHPDFNRLLSDAKAAFDRDVALDHSKRHTLDELAGLLRRNQDWTLAEQTKLNTACANDMRAAALSRYAVSVFKDAEHASKCARTRDFVRGEGGIDKLKELKRKHAELKERKLDVDKMDYEEVLGKLKMNEGSLVLMTWQDRSASLLRVIKQQPGVERRSHVSFEVVFRAKTRTCLSLPFETVREFTEVVCAGNANSVLGTVSQEKNLRALFDSRSAVPSKMSYPDFSRVVVKQSRDAIEGQLGLAGVLQRCPAAARSPLEGLAQAAEAAEKMLEDGDEVAFVGAQSREERDRIGMRNAVVIE